MALVGIYGSAIAIGGSLIVAILSSVGPTEGVIENEVKPVESAGQREDLLSGLMFVWNHPILLPALSIDMVCVLFGGVTALLPVYADQVLHTGAEGLGALRAAPAIGAAFMGYVLTSVDLRARAGQYFLWAVAGFGVSTIAFSVSTSFWISLGALFMAGLFDSVSVVVRSSAVQLCSPPDMRGRISSVNTMFIGSSNEIGEVESGVLAHYIGTVPTAVFGGVMCLVVLAVAAVKSPKLRALDLRALE
jgi:hypothetical protein